MSQINNALRSIIENKKDFCCLCLISIHEGDPIRINDEVVVNINNYEYDIAVAEVLNFIFEEGMYNYVSTFDSLCGQCVQSAISHYKFLQTSQKTAEYLTSVLDGLSNSFQYTPDDFSDSKSLYVSLNLDDFTSKQYYDVKSPASSPKAALRRYHALDSTKKIEDEDSVLKNIKKEHQNINVKEKKKKKLKYNIPIEEMLYDVNNPNLNKCKDCQKVYPNIWNLKNHYIRVHCPKLFKCPECPRKYGSPAFLDAHRRESHCAVVCSQCGRTFKNRQTLKMHEMGHHLSFVCQDCGRVYKNKTTFRKHVELNVCGQETRAHPSEAKFTCDYCNKKYTQKVSLRVHIQYEHGNYKAHICEWCGKKFWAQSRLKAHIVKHTKERNFSCSICEGKFVSKESLLYHTRTHTGEKPYKCPHCDSRFLSTSRRTEHVKRHHVGATLECDVCHSKFNSRSFLLKHQKCHYKTGSTMYSYESTIINDAKSSQNVTNTEIKGKDDWSISKFEEDTIACSQKIDSSEVDFQFVEQAYEEETKQQFDVRNVFLEASDDVPDFSSATSSDLIKILI